MAVQRSLFPVTLQFATPDAILLSELLEELHLLGYEVEPFGKDAFVVQGTPADVDTGDEKKAIENLLEQYKHFSSDLKFTKREKLFRSLAWQQAIKAGTALSQKEMKSLGMKMSAKDIYDVNKSSLKDAVPQFNGGCTSEMISPKGLLLLSLQSLSDSETDPPASLARANHASSSSS